MGINPRAVVPSPPPGPWWYKIVPVALTAATMGLGWYYETQETQRATLFRDKSALYRGRNPDPENKPSWGTNEPYKWRFNSQ